ncbi:PstS family phosphate ABC transporter substrate-binding protein [Bacillus sp. AFS053548]|uniref:PstS family phosphate ABC transporter substrate-binding protein n=1 Tax=Bacillus sp. AFS053548 TaxID=2033505 RepID=UPI000BFB629B|nr:PstS family phosphate ABC transporter substrate-binding protein [Bacillus sp. AFS053548]PGM56756.1 phosphate-binding protein [Bacillus sp. AFS053548]
MQLYKVLLIVVVITAMLSLAACGFAYHPNSSTSEKQLTGSVLIDGSSTVFPIMQTITKQYSSAQPEVTISLGNSGSIDGFKKFANGITDINDASRPITNEEDTIARHNNIDYIQLKLAYDGLSVVVNKDNDFVNQLTVEQLKKLWSVNSKIKTWNELNSAWPKEEIRFFSPGNESATYEYFNKKILNEAGERKDAQTSEDDKNLVADVASEKGAIGYFGHAYYEENKDQLKIVPIVNPKTGKAVLPTEETIKNGTYPLSRELYTYVNINSLKHPVVLDYLKFANENAPLLAEQVGYIPLEDEQYEININKIEEARHK